MTRRRLSRALVCSVLAAVVIAPAGYAQRREVQPVERVAAFTRPAIVYLEVFWEGWLRDQRDGKVWLGDAIQTGATCSGSLLTPDGYVLTAGHCVEAELIVPDIVQGVVDAYVANGDVAQEDANSFYDEVAANSLAEGPGDEGAPLVPNIIAYRGIIEDGERSGDSYDAVVVDMQSFLHGEGDTAILKMSRASDLPTIELSDETDIGVGTPIVAVGYPGSVSRIIDPTLEPTFKDGTVSAQRTQNRIPFYEVSAASSPGMSGGPVVDMEGRQVGVVSQAPADESQSFNLMVSVSVGQDLMAANEVRRRAGPNDAAYRRGLEQLFAGSFDESIASFDEVLEADPKHQQAFEIRAQAVSRRREGGGSATAAGGGGFPFVAIVPLLLGLGGVGYTLMRRRAQPAGAAAAASPTTTPPFATPPSTPPVSATPMASAAPAGAIPSAATPQPSDAAAPHDPLRCSRCGNVHVREVAFCTKCGNTMGPTPPSATPPSVTAPAAASAAASSSRDRLVLIGSVAAVAVAAVLFVSTRGSDEGGVLPTAQPTATAPPRAEGDSIEGQWASTFGPVTLEHGRIRGDDPVDVTGSWLQGSDKLGEITSGTYDPAARTLEIAYVETWSEVEGTATFDLSRNGNTLEGTYEQPGARGAWTLTR